MRKFIKKLFCRHHLVLIKRWHWTHGYNGNNPLLIEIECECRKCHKVVYRYIYDREDCKLFAKLYRDLEVN